MILRRVIDHFRKQEWTAIFLDFIIVVIGVFVGIQVSNWNASRQERLREARYLERLDVEMDVIRERLVGGADVFERSVRNIDRLLVVRRQYDANPEYAAPTDEALGGAANDVTSGRVPAGSPAAFKEMVANGALDTLTSVDLRQALFTYDEFAAVARDGWRTLRDEHQDAANIISSLVDAAAPEDLSDLGGAGTSDLALVGFKRAEFLEGPDIPGALGILLRTQINQLALVQTQLALAEDIEALIAKEQAP